MNHFRTDTPPRPVAYEDAAALHTSEPLAVPWLVGTAGYGTASHTQQQATHHVE